MNHHLLEGLGLGAAGAALGLTGTWLALSVPAEGQPWKLPSWRPARWHQLRGVIIGATIAGVAAGTVGLKLGYSVVAPAYVFCAVGGVALGVVDIRRKRLPYVMTSALYLSCLIAFTIASIAGRDATSIVRALASSTGTLVAFLALALAFPGQLGLGDVFLLGWVAFSLAWLGWHPMAVGVLAGLAVQAAAGVAGRIRLGPGAKLPLGPALLAGWLIGVLAAG